MLDLTGLVLPDEIAPVFETRFRRQALLAEAAPTATGRRRGSRAFTAA
ncbi:MAG: hypothetical protein U1E17_03035 [Geminicoccaceae bacterium]